MHERKMGGMEAGIQNIKKKYLFQGEKKKWFLNFIGFTAIAFGSFTKTTLFFTD